MLYWEGSRILLLFPYQKEKKRGMDTKGNLFVKFAMNESME